MNPNDQQFEARVKKIAEDAAVATFAELLKKQQMGSFQVQQHTHNGVDSPRLTEDVIIRTVKLQSRPTCTNSGGSPDEQSITIRGVNNPSRISFHGWAAKVSDGAFAVTTGEVIFGRTYQVTGTTAIVDVDTSTPGTYLVQNCNFMFVKGSEFTSFNVGNLPFMGGVVDDSSTLVGSMYIDTSEKYTAPGTITITVYLAAGWTIEGDIIIE